MIKIGDFSKFSMISIRMLRHYNEIGLLIPEKIDNFTGYRYYSAQQLSVANKIQSLKSMGFSLLSIKDIINDYDDYEKLKNYLKIHYLQLKKEANIVNEKIMMVENTIERLGKGDIIMNYDVNIKEFPQMYVMSLRKIIPSYDKEGDVWQELNMQATKLNIHYTTPPINQTVYFDEGYKDKDVDIEVQSSVVGKYNDTENIHFKTIDAVKVATVIIKGSFNQISNVYKAIADWIENNNYEICGNMFEIYHVSPAMDSNPNNWITEICLPIKKI